MEVKDIKPGMIIVTRNRRVYIVHNTNNNPHRETDCVGVRKFGWVSIRFNSDFYTRDFDVISVFSVKQAHALVDIYRAMGNIAEEDSSDEESISLLLNEKYFEQIYPTLKRVKKSEIVKQLGYNFEIEED